MKTRSLHITGMLLPWLAVFYIVSFPVLVIGQQTESLRSTAIVAATVHQTVFTQNLEDQVSTDVIRKQVSPGDEQPSPSSSEESGVAKATVQQTETTDTVHRSDGDPFRPAQRIYDSAMFFNQTDSAEENQHPVNDNFPGLDPDMCNITEHIFKELQRFSDLENIATFRRGSNTSTCEFTTLKNASAKFDEDGQFISSATVDTVRFITQELATPIIAFPGCVFNIISIYVLVKQGSESSSTRYLIALGVADLSFLLSGIILWVLSLLNEYHYHFYVSLRVAFKYGWMHRYFIILTGRFSNILVLILSLDRFIAVKSPLKAKTLPLSRYPIKFALALFLSLAVFLTPNVFRAEFAELTYPGTNKSELVFRWTQFADSNPVFYRIYSSILLVALRLVPVLFVFIFNIAIILLVKFSGSSRVTKHVIDDRREQRELKVTRMLVTISLIFLICVTPGLIHTLISNYYPAYSFFGTYKNTYLVFLYMYPVLDVINSTVNFFVYVSLSDRFRAVFLERFCRRVATESEVQQPSN